MHEITQICPNMPISAPKRAENRLFEGKIATIRAIIGTFSAIIRPRRGLIVGTTGTYSRPYRGLSRAYKALTKAPSRPSRYLQKAP